LAGRWLPLLVRDSERLEAGADLGDRRVDRGVRALAGDVDGPGGQNVAEPVELLGDAKEVDDVGLSSVICRGVLLERVPQRGTLALEQRPVLTERPLEPPDEIEDVVYPLGLRLRIADEGGAQAPVLGVGTLGEVDELGEGGRLDLSGHGEQRTKPHRIERASTVLD
jgi:hypothetical protein